jgi:hypothetical protein
VELAELALHASGGQGPEFWDTLAAAQAEAGNFKAAVEAEEKALRQAQAMRADDLIPGIGERLELFFKKDMRYHHKAERPLRM